MFAKAWFGLLSRIPFVAFGAAYRRHWELPNGGSLELPVGAVPAYFFLNNDSAGTLYVDIHAGGGDRLKRTHIVALHGHLVQRLEAGDGVTLEDYAHDHLPSMGTWQTVSCP